MASSGTTGGAQGNRAFRLDNSSNDELELDILGYQQQDQPPTHHITSTFTPSVSSSTLVLPPRDNG